MSSATTSRLPGIGLIARWPTRNTRSFRTGPSDAHTLLADIYGRTIGLEGFLAAVRFGSKAESETQTALRLNPDNPRVHFTLGRRCLYSPKMFGGDLDQEIAPFKKRPCSIRSPIEAFRWLAIACSQKKIVPK